MDNNQTILKKLSDFLTGQKLHFGGGRVLPYINLQVHSAIKGVVLGIIWSGKGVYFA